MKQKDVRALFEPQPFDYEALMKCVTALDREYPFLSFNYLGNSIMGRGIPLLSIGKGQREVLYVGTHHGMEWITSLCLMRFVGELCECIQSNTMPYRISAELYLQSHTLYIVPMLNPDGVEYQIHGVEPDNPLFERLIAMNGDSDDFSKWQANARGVDLNHNYNAGFAEYKEVEAENGIMGGCATRYSGEAPESEPETASLCNFIRFHDRLRGVLTLHTQGEEIFYKSGETLPKRSEGVAKRLSNLTGYRLSVATGSASYGGLTDWCVRSPGLPSFTLECGRGVNPLPLLQFLPIYMGLREALFRFPMLL